MPGTSSADPRLLCEQDGAVLTLSINDAPRNRMSLAFMDALETEIGRIGADDSVRAVVIRGAGTEKFLVGMDLKQLPMGIQQKGSANALFDRARELARELASMPAVAVGEMLRCIVGAEGRSLQESIADERAAVKATLGTRDQAEGLQAFLQKRKPVFNQ